MTIQLKIIYFHNSWFSANDPKFHANLRGLFTSDEYITLLECVYANTRLKHDALNIHISVVI